MWADIQCFKNRAVTDNCQSLDFKAIKQMDKDQKEEDVQRPKREAWNCLSWVQELVKDKKCGSTHREKEIANLNLTVDKVIP